MRKIIALTALALAGCSTQNYQMDRQALPEAQRARQAGWAKCAAELSDGPMVPLMECHNANNRAFVAAIHYRDNGAFEVYLDRLRLLALDADAGRITKDEFYRRIGTIYAEHDRLIGAH